MDTLKPEYSPTLDLFFCPTIEVQNFIHPHDGLHLYLCDRLGFDLEASDTLPIRLTILDNWEAREAVVERYVKNFRYIIGAPEMGTAREFAEFG